MQCKAFWGEPEQESFINKLDGSEISSSCLGQKAGEGAESENCIFRVHVDVDASHDPIIAWPL